MGTSKPPRFMTPTCGRARFNLASLYARWLSVIAVAADLLDWAAPGP